MTAYIECAFRWGEDAFWVPILPTGIYVKDLARAIKDRFDCVTSDMFVAHPVTAVPYPGKKWLMPYEPVRVWVVPLGQLPSRLSSLPLSAQNCGGEYNIATEEYISEVANSDDKDTTPEASTFAHTAVDTEQADQDTMPFHAVRAGRKTGIFLSKAEVLPQVVDFAGAEYKTFASFAEASAYLTGSLAAVGERDLMSAGSRAKHPPPKSTAPEFSAVVPVSAQLGIINAVFHCVADPDTRTAYCVATLYPACSKDASMTHTFTLDGMPSPARAELSAVVLVLRACTDVPGYAAGRTLVRTYCASTYATNAINDYAVNKVSFAGANGSIMAALSELLKAVKARAFWTAQTDPILAETIRKTIQLRLRGGKGAGDKATAAPA